MASQAFSQPPAFSLVVTNQTNCTVYYRIVGDEICVCGETYSSPILALGPGGTVTYPNTTVLGGSYPMSPPKSIVAAYIYADTVRDCQNLPFGVVGTPGCGYPLIYTYQALRFCQPCRPNPVTARWTPAPSCQGQARLDFF